VNTMPANYRIIGETLPGHVENTLERLAKAGIDTDSLGSQLQDDGAASFVKSWKDLMECIASKSKIPKAL
jgi:transaldolase